MKKIVPFNKEIKFNTMLSKITSISLEHTLNVEEDNYIKGNFIVSGSYNMTPASQIDEEFSYKVPVEIQIDDKYDINDIILDIDDFTYEIVNEDTLSVNISLCIDNIKEKNDEVESIRFDEEEVTDLFLDTSKNEKEDLEIEEHKELETNQYNNIDIKYEDNEIKEKPKNNNSEVVSSLFASFKDSAETFKTYSVYTVNENDTIDSILNKYGIDKEMLEEYNVISEIKKGSKVIIPCPKNE